MRPFLAILLFIGVLFPCLAQTDSWSSLGMVQFKTEYNSDWGMETKIPTLSPIVKMLEGKELAVEGYIIPLTGEIAQYHFMLSKFPQNMCFFCGMAGPETAMQVFSKDKKKIAFTRDKVKVKGILRINETDQTNPLYTLEEAVVIN